MKSDMALDYAVFQLSPKRSRCELFVSSNGNTEKLASGLVKPFVTHLKVAEEQVALAIQTIKLEVENHKHAETWFTKGTLERFVRFVSTPEVLELVNTFDAEMSQLEAAQRIYSQGAGDQQSGALGGAATGATKAADATKKELLRAIDVRLVAVRQDLTTTCARASAAGFNPDSVSELRFFADQFGAHRLKEACTKFISLYRRRSDILSTWKPGVNDRAVRSSTGSDMSLDDPTEDTTGSHYEHHPAVEDQVESDPLLQRTYHPNQSLASTCQQPKSLATTVSARLDLNERKELRDEATRSEPAVRNDKKEEALIESSSIAASQPARRLSVQDRINLFENKQKENSGGKPVVGKPVELRRLSSDVSSGPAAAEKAVLRRWSGASDMSIDLSGEKKNVESPLCTPSYASSVSHSQDKSHNVYSGASDDKDRKGLNDTQRSSKVDSKSGSDRDGDVGLKDKTEVHSLVSGILDKEEEVGSKVRTNWKEKARSQNQFGGAFTGRAEPVGVNDPVVFKDCKESVGGVKDQVVIEAQLRGFSTGTEVVGTKNQVVTFVNKAGDGTYDGGFVSRVEHSELGNQLVTQPRSKVSQSHSGSFSGQFDGASELKLKETPLAQPKGLEGDQLDPQPKGRSYSGELEEIGKKELRSLDGRQTKVEDCGVQSMKIQKLVSSGREPIKKTQGRKDEIGLAYENSNLDYPSKKVSEMGESFSLASTMPLEKDQRVRQSKGNQEFNDELKMKANELEKLFAEHKLRVPGDQSSSAWRNKLDDKQTEQAASFQYRKPAAAEITPMQLPNKKSVIAGAGSTNQVAKFNTPSPPMKVVDNKDYGSTPGKGFSELSFTEDSRGKSYERYMQKRDAKLREEWNSKRSEKEAKMKAMQDNLEQSRTEMKAKFSASATKQDSFTSASRRAEKLRSFNFQSNMKREQHAIDCFQSEDDEGLSKVPGQKLYGQDKFFNEASVGDVASRSAQTKKFLPNKNLSSSTPRTTSNSAPRSSSKISNTSSGKRRMQSENPLAQSVPNFSDFRKENTKPSSGVSKTTTRPQARNFGRSKSTNEDVPNAKEEKPRRSQALRKSFGNPVEFKDLSLLNSDNSVLAPLKFDRDQIEHSSYEKSPKNGDSKPFLRKGNGIGPDAGVSFAKLKASVPSESLENDEEFEESVFEAEDSVDMVKEEEEEKLETIQVKAHAGMDNGKKRLSQESDNATNSESEIDDSMRSLSQVDPPSVAELPATEPSTFHGVGSLQDSPGGSPVSWNSRLNHPFSFPHETSDIDASVDSPIGSPASWNSHSLTQSEADAARMRKKWGTAQKPIVVANNSSHNQSRKDVTKGFKRLLKFGRKSRGTESLVDWISATTSEGDDDAEDGRDVANRSSEDLRKSRMGFSQGHTSDDSFIESEFNEQVQALQSSIPVPPSNFKLRDDHMSGSSLKASRSFFSLSSFRSKGSDSKLR